MAIYSYFRRARLSTDVPSGFVYGTTLPLTMSFGVAAGTHTVIVECNQGVGSNSTVKDRVLSVLATD